MCYLIKICNGDHNVLCLESKCYVKRNEYDPYKVKTRDFFFYFNSNWPYDI